MIRVFEHHVYTYRMFANLLSSFCQLVLSARFELERIAAYGVRNLGVRRQVPLCLLVITWGVQHIHASDTDKQVLPNLCETRGKGARLFCPLAISHV